jgi:hypothetical protein
MLIPRMRPKPDWPASLHAPITPPAGPDNTVRTGSAAASCAGTNPPGRLHDVNGSAMLLRDRLLQIEQIAAHAG